MAPAEPLAVVPVTLENWQAYRDIRLRALRLAPRAYGSTYAESRQRTDANWRAFVQRAHLWLAYADADQPPIGTVGVWANPDLPPDSAYLIGMWVEESARGRGVADALVATVLDHARANGAARVLLDVADENLAAVACYRRLGFTPTGVTGALPWDETVTESQFAFDLV